MLEYYMYLYKNILIKYINIDINIYYKYFKNISKENLIYVLCYAQ